MKNPLLIIIFFIVLISCSDNKKENPIPIPVVSKIDKISYNVKITGTNEWSAEYYDEDAQLQLVTSHLSDWTVTFENKAKKPRIIGIKAFSNECTSITVTLYVNGVNRGGHLATVSPIGHLSLSYTQQLY